jgi:hypothetical protein
MGFESQPMRLGLIFSRSAIYHRAEMQGDRGFPDLGIGAGAHIRPGCAMFR